MKTIILVLAFACIFYSASACGTGDCGSCTTWDDCSGVTGDECSWNYNTDVCATAPTDTTTACTILNNIPGGCEAEAECGAYDYSANTCHN